MKQHKKHDWNSIEDKLPKHLNTVDFLVNIPIRGSYSKKIIRGYYIKNISSPEGKTFIKLNNNKENIPEKNILGWRYI